MRESKWKIKQSFDCSYIDGIPLYYILVRKISYTLLLILKSIKYIKL